MEGEEGCAGCLGLIFGILIFAAIVEFIKVLAEGLALIVVGGIAVWVVVAIIRSWEESKKRSEAERWQRLRRQREEKEREQQRRAEQNARERKEREQAEHTRRKIREAERLTLAQQPQTALEVLEHARPRNRRGQIDVSHARLNAQAAIRGERAKALAQKSDAVKQLRRDLKGTTIGKDRK